MSDIFDFFKNLPEKDISRQGYFIAEGTIVVRRLLRSSLTCKAIICLASQADRMKALAPDVPLRIFTKKEMSAIVGFDFHRGALALGCIPSVQGDAKKTITSWVKEGATKIVLLPHCSDPQNLGALIRSARALGFTAVVLSSRSCALYSRRSIRVAMGSMFDFPVLQVADFSSWVQTCACSMPVWALSISASSVALQHKKVPTHIALMLGNEGTGLTEDERALATDEVCIPMASGTDSLNLAASAAIAMYALTSFSLLPLQYKQ